MSLLTLEEAAARLGVPRQTIETWVSQGLLTACPGPDVYCLPSEPNVEEDRLLELADSLGWLHLSAKNWDGDGCRGPIRG